DPPGDEQVEAGGGQVAHRSRLRLGWLIAQVARQSRDTSSMRSVTLCRSLRMSLSRSSRWTGCPCERAASHRPLPGEAYHEATVSAVASWISLRSWIGTRWLATASTSA